MNKKEKTQTICTRDEGYLLILIYSLTLLSVAVSYPCYLHDSFIATPVTAPRLCNAAATTD